MSARAAGRGSSPGILAAGDVVDHFKVRRLLGRGGTGEVYLARDTTLGRRVALKLLRPEAVGDAEALERMLYEARVTAQFSHPHIVTVFSVGEHRGQPYLALEYLDGQSLRQRMADDPPPERETLRIGLAIAEALVEAHRHKVLHRDLKPENVIIPRDGRLRVVDFGLAKPFAAPRPLSDEGLEASALAAWEGLTGDRYATRRDAIVGTPTYMAPEQWLGRPVTAATDVWALGVILFELLAGRAPFVAGSIPELMGAICEPEPAPGLDAPVSPELAALVAACLSKEPEGRPSAEQVGATLRGLLDPGRGRAAAAGTIPFRGLLPFTEGDAALFFGREADVAMALEHLRSEPVLPVIGPSGAGKSSFVQAGLIPALRERSRWVVVSLRPGTSPFATLAARLRRALGHEFSSDDLGAMETTRDPGTSEGPVTASAAPTARDEESRLAAELLETPSVLSLWLQRLADERGAPVVLFVDQLEELYSQVPDAETRRRFMDAVCSAADDPQGQVRVVFTLRDDFLGRATETEAARRALGRIAVLRSPGPEALREILVLPLERAGYRWEDPALVGEMVAAVSGEPACLPVLQFACDLLWEHRDEQRKVLTRAAYEAMGGVEGALARHADRVIDGLSPEQERLARQLLLRLVTPEGTRRAAARDALLEGLGPDAEEVLGQLVAGRMVSSRRGHGGGPARAPGEGEVELAHESLVQRWARLARWIEDSREDVALVAEVGQAAELWERRGRPNELLWRGEALGEAARTLRRSTVRGSAIAEAFVAAALGRERRRTLLARGLAAAVVGSLAALALVFGVLWTAADQQRAFAERQRAEADEQRTRAQARQAEATREGARLAFSNGSYLEARAKLRLALELEREPSPASRALWWQLAAEPLLWHREVGDIINDAEIAPDGSTIALASDDFSIYLVDSNTAQARVLRGQGEEVFTIGFSPDGSTLASGAPDGTVILWDLRTSAQPRAQLHLHHSNGVRKVQFSPDGRLLAVVSRDRTVSLWDAASATSLRTLAGHEGLIEDIAFSRDSKRVVSASADGTLRTWDVATGRELKRFTGHTGDVRGATFLGDGSRIVSVSLDKTVRVWDAETGAQLQVLAGHTDGVYDVDVSPDGARIATASWDSTVRLWDAASGELLRTLPHPVPIFRLDFSPDGARLVAASLGRSVFLWDLSLGGSPRRDGGHESATTSAAFSPDGATLATASRDKSIRLWDVASGEQLRVLEGHTDEVWGVRIAPAGDVLYSVSWDKTIRAWDMASGARLRVLEGHTDSVHNVDLDPAGTTLATGGWDKTIRTWDATTGESRFTYEAHILPRDTEFSPDGTLIAAGGNDGRVFVLDAATGAERWVVKEHTDTVYDVDFSPDGRELASASWDKTIRVWDVASGTTSRVIEAPARVNSLAYAADGRRLFVGAGEGTLRIIDARTGDVLGELGGHLKRVSKIVPDRAGKVVATTSVDGTVRLWDVATGAPLWRAPLLAAPTSEGGAPLLLSHRGWSVVEGPEPGTLRATSAGSSRWMQAVEQRARYADGPGADGLLCLQTHDGALEVWDTAADRLVGREAIAGLDQVVALTGACAARTRGGRGEVAGARLYDGRGPSKALQVTGPVTALASAGERLLVAAGSEVLAFDLAGAVVDRFPSGEGVTAMVFTGLGTLALGFREGNIQLLPRGGAAPSRVFEQVSPSAVLRLARGPEGTLIAGFANGTVGLWDTDDGALLRRARIHGPVTHLLINDRTLVVATDLGQVLRWDLSVFYENRCELLWQVWAKVPVSWRGGRPVASAPPPDDACRPPPARP